MVRHSTNLRGKNSRLVDFNTDVHNLESVLAIRCDRYLGQAFGGCNLEYDRGAEQRRVHQGADKAAACGTERVEAQVMVGLRVGHKAGIVIVNKSTVTSASKYWVTILACAFCIAIPCMAIRRVA